MSRLTYVLVVVVGVALLSGCAAPADTESTLPAVYRESVDRVLAGSPNSFVRDALSDYHVSDAEFREARQQFADCVETRAPGLIVTFPAEAGSTVEQTSEFKASFGSGEAADEAAQAATDKAIDDCGLEFLTDIEFVYVGVRENPWGYSNFPDAVRDCFSEAGEPDGEQLSEADFADLVMDEAYVPSTAEGQACIADPFSELKRLGVKPE